MALEFPNRQIKPRNMWNELGSAWTLALANPFFLLAFQLPLVWLLLK